MEGQVLNGESVARQRNRFPSTWSDCSKLKAPPCNLRQASPIALARLVRDGPRTSLSLSLCLRARAHASSVNSSNESASNMTLGNSASGELARNVSMYNYSGWFPFSECGSSGIGGVVRQKFGATGGVRARPEQWWRLHLIRSFPWRLWCEQNVNKRSIIRLSDQSKNTWREKSEIDTKTKPKAALTLHRTKGTLQT